MFKPSKIRAYLGHLPDIDMHADQILEGSGVSWADIDALKPLALPMTASLFDRLAGMAPRNFAFFCGEKTRVRNFGIVGYAMMSSGTLRQAFERWNHYCLIVGHPLITTIEEQGDQWKFLYVPRMEMTTAALRFCIEASLSGLESVIHELTGTPADSLRFDFSYGMPDNLSEYRAFGDKPLFFNQAVTAYHGLRHNLDRPVLAGDADMQELCDQQCARQLADILHYRKLEDRIREMFMGCLGHIPTIEEAARNLNLSRRTLQRGLQQEGCTYKDVVENFRKNYAFALLEEGRLEVKNIAFLLGYQDVGSFRRAFHNWTNTTIGHWLSAISTGRYDEIAVTPALFVRPAMRPIPNGAVTIGV